MVAEDETSASTVALAVKLLSDDGVLLGDYLILVATCVRKFLP
jgi:hypothetical protein